MISRSAAGDWDCPKCRAMNFASRRQCFRARLREPEAARRRIEEGRTSFLGWRQRKESGGPKAVVDALPASVWWLNPDQITEERVEAIARERGLDPSDVDVDALKEAASHRRSLDDDNFTEPSFNERVRRGMADPDVREPLAADRGAATTRLLMRRPKSYLSSVVTLNTTHLHTTKHYGAGQTS